MNDKVTESAETSAAIRTWVKRAHRNLKAVVLMILVINKMYLIRNKINKNPLNHNNCIRGYLV